MFSQERIALLREMLNTARSPNDPENGIYPCDFPFAKLGIRRLRSAYSQKNNGGYLARVDELREKAESAPRIGTGNDFHAAMTAGFDYAVLLIDEWFAMCVRCEVDIEPKHEGPTDGACQG